MYSSLIGSRTVHFMFYVTGIILRDTHVDPLAHVCYVVPRRARTGKHALYQYIQVFFVIRSHDTLNSFTGFTTGHWFSTMNTYSVNLLLIMEYISQVGTQSKDICECMDRRGISRKLCKSTRFL